MWRPTTPVLLLAFLLSFCFYSLAVSATTQPHSLVGDSIQQVTNLPNLPTGYSGKIWSGYITVDAKNNRRLFFMFFESLKSPATDPVVVWNTGGPGCSSLLAAFSEMGPFWPTAGGKTLQLNPYAWNNVANMLYIESPAGVGFSLSDVASDYVVGDKRTAQDEYVFLQGFFSHFPALRANPFWVTGESYGGHYVPNLTHVIYQNNVNSTNPRINLQGFMVGNAWTDAVSDNRGSVIDWWGHALISEDTRDNMNKYCDWSIIGPLLTSTEEWDADAFAQDQCDFYTNRAMQEMGDITIYQIYQDVCVQQHETPASRLVRALAQTPRSPHRALLSKLDVASAAVRGPAPPCIDAYYTAYLNRADVQAALGAPRMQWNGCSDKVQYSRADLLSSMVPVYRDLIDNANIRILVYSGDIGAICSFEGTRIWIDLLNLKIQSSHVPWMVNQQVAGYFTKYEKNFNFSTVRNAGHMVPGQQPERALYLFSHFLNNQPF